MKPYLIFILVFGVIAAGFSQKTDISFDSIFLQMDESLNRMESISFSATLHTKKFSSDTFKEKKFEVFARKNPNNMGYNYDWEIVEYKNESEQRYIFIGKEFFYINKLFPTIGYSNNIIKLSPGDYFENMRWNTLFDEFIYSMNKLYIGKEIIADFENKEKSLKLIIKIDSIQDREIVIGLDNFLPISARNIVRQKEMNLTQIIETKLANLKINEHFPDSILNPQYYLNQSYEFKYKEQESEHQDSMELLTDNEIKFLFEVLLTSSGSDTARLKDISGDLFLIDFWFMSCIPCLKSIPHLQEISNKYRDRNLKVIGINCHDGQDKEKVGKKLSEIGITYDNYFAEKELIQKLRITAFPTLLIIGKDKSVKFLGVGLGKDFDSIIEEEIKKLK